MISALIPFAQNLKNNGLKIERRVLETLQVNLGKLCNQACHHCHVEAGPNRIEVMEKSTIDQILKLIDGTPSIEWVDLTGGAPELNPHFRFLVRELRKRNKKVIDRCNLTVLFEAGQEDTLSFLKENKVKVVASLPCYSKANVEQQRGRGVFDKSIRALKLLNDAGYAQEQSGLVLDLVYNPLGATLPPAQAQLEMDYKRELKSLFGIEFNRLYAITNMPIKRFLDQLKRQGEVEKYRSLLLESFNPETARGVMCRDLISISWNGLLYDCDFNQMLEIGLLNARKNIWQIASLEELSSSPIAFSDHCYGCTAGEGSSCGGALL